MGKNYLTGLLLIFLVANVVAQTPYFYYYKGEKQYLELDTKHIFVSVADENAAGEFASKNKAAQPFCADIPAGMQPKTNFKRYCTELVFENHLSEETYLSKLTEIRNSGKDVIAAPYFKNKEIDEIGLSNFFYVKLKSLADSALLRQLAEKEDAVIVFQDEYMPLWWTLSITGRSKYNAMEVANRFYETGNFQCAEPDLNVAIQPGNSTGQTTVNCGLDGYDQWNLIGQYGINVCPVWELSTGSGVTVAVFDTGIQPNHPDLAANIHPYNYDVDTGQDNQQQVSDYHGTAVAGVIGAKRNDINKVVGVAPDCKVMSISRTTALLSSSNPTLASQKMASGFRKAMEHGADVINCSWYWSIVAGRERITDAIDSATNFGRGGKGCVIVAASDNKNAPTVSYPANLPSVIAVGATDRSGYRCDFSNYGSGLNVVAPGTEIRTTSTGSTYAPFLGTSAAAPHVAGIVALILSIRPDLTVTQVRAAIENNCTTSLPGYNSWYVGNGLVNASAAVSSVAASISGPEIVSYGISGSSYTLNCQIQSLPNVTWSVTQGFSVFPSGGTAIVTANQTVETGTLTAYTTVNNKTVPVATKTIRATTISSSGSSSVCNSGTTFTLNNPPSGLGTVYWTVSDNSILSVHPSSGSFSTTVTRTTGTSDHVFVTLSARKGSATGTVIASKLISPCRTYIYGSDALCNNTGSYTLTNPPPGVGTIHWTLSGATSNFTINSSTGAITHTGTGTGSVTLSARNGNAECPVVASMTVSSCPPYINGQGDIFHPAVFSLSGGATGNWTVTEGFQITTNPTNTNSVTVKPTNYNGKYGTLTATVNGCVVTMSVYAYNLSRSFPTFSCASTVQFEVEDHYGFGITDNRVTWEYSYHLEPIGGNKGMSKQFNVVETGTAWVKATVVTNYNTTVIEEPFIAKFPSPYSFVITNNEMICDHVYRLSPQNDAFDLYNPYGQYITGFNGWTASRTDIFHVETSPSNREATVEFYNCGADPMGYMISATVTTACGSPPSGYPIYNYYFYKPRSGSSSSSIYSNDSNSVSSSISSSSVVTYPNPAGDILYVEIKDPLVGNTRSSQTPACDVRLYNWQGLMLRQQKTMGNRVEFNVSNLPNGVYFLHVYDGVNAKPEALPIVVEH